MHDVPGFLNIFLGDKLLLLKLKMQNVHTCSLFTFLQFLAIEIETRRNSVERQSIW